MVLASMLAAASLTLAPQAAPEPAALVEVGHADWEAFPELKSRDRRFPNIAMIARVETMLKEKQCRFPGNSYKNFDITVPYAVQMEPTGQISRVVVADIGCPPLETYVGSLVLKQADLGDFSANSPARPRWYSSSVNFNLQ